MFSRAPGSLDSSFSSQTLTFFRDMTTIASKHSDYSHFVRPSSKNRIPPSRPSTSVDSRSRAEQENVYKLLSQCRTSQRGAATSSSFGQHSLRSPGYSSYSPHLTVSADKDTMSMHSQTSRRPSGQKSSYSGNTHFPTFLFGFLPLLEASFGCSSIAFSSFQASSTRSIVNAISKTSPPPSTEWLPCWALVGRRTPCRNTIQVPCHNAHFFPTASFFCLLTSNDFFSSPTNPGIAFF